MTGILKSIASITATFIIYLLGGWDIALQSLVTVIIIDYFTGICKAYINKKLNSNIGFKGAIKKVAMLCLVALSVRIDTVTGGTGMIRTLIIYYLVANEGLSIVENLSEMNIVVPKFIKDKLEQLKKDNSKVGDSNDKRY